MGLGDEMIRSQLDEDGTPLPPYGFINDDEYKKVQPKDAICILYGIKANGPLNSQIHGNAYSRLTGGKVRFLIKEQEAKSELLATKAGQKMTTEQRVKRLMPHEMTTKLFEEMANLRLRRAGASLDIVLEQINSRYPKDKYSAFAYGLWRINELEIEEYKPEHIALTDSDIFVIAPATANTISKIANGICDNLLLSTACAFNKPILLCASDTFYKSFERKR